MNIRLQLNKIRRVSIDMNLYIIENNREFGNSWSRTLKLLGHKVTLCQNLESITIDNVKEKTPDLALVDRRAKRDSDDADFSGEEFAIKLCEEGTPAVLMTNYLPAHSTIFELIRTNKLYGVMDKGIYPDVLTSCLERYALSKRFPNTFARVEYIGNNPLSKSNTPTISIQENVELEVLIRSLISPCATGVILNNIKGGQSGAYLFRAQVSSGDGPVVEDLAIKVGEKTMIKSEELRYDRFVGGLPDGVAAQLRWRAETQNMGALAYSWVGDSIEDGVPIGPFGTDNWKLLTWPRRRNAIRRLFSVSLNPWYEIFRSKSSELYSPKLLLEHYLGRGGIWYKEMNLDKILLPFSGLPESYPVKIKQGMWDFGQSGQLIDPIEWIKQKARSKLKFRQQSPIHGDLHIGNLFVLPDDSPRLIDFGRTTLGHIFRDFAALEVSIRLTCIGDTDLSMLKTVEDLVCGVKSLGQYIDYRNIPKNYEDIRETIKATMEIRRAALDAAGGYINDSSIQEYLFAVVLHMLRYAIGIADEVKDKDDTQKYARIWHAHYGAALAASTANNISNSYNVSNK